MELQPPLDATATTWLLTVRSCLLRSGLPWVNLLEASLVVKEPYLEGLTGGPWSSLPLELIKLLILLCHTSGCMTLSKEWPIEPHAVE